MLKLNNDIKPLEKKQNKYCYSWVIQQYYFDCWEDSSEYDKNVYKYSDMKHDLKEYRIMGYPTRVINRRELSA